MHSEWVLCLWSRPPACSTLVAQVTFPRRSLETIAVEGYRIGALTETQVRRLLQLETRFQVHALFKEHRVPLRYTEVDLEDDLRAHRELGVLPGR